MGDVNNYPTPSTSRRQPGNDSSTPWVCVCRKEFATEKGMNIHKGRMKCGQLLSQDLRQGHIRPNNTVEEPDQDNHHSVWSLTDTNSTTALTQTVDAAIDGMESAASRNDLQLLNSTQVINALFTFSQEADYTPHTPHQPGTQHQSTQDSQRSQIVNDKPKERIKWPASNMKKEWSQFEADAASTLTLVLKGTAERKMEVMSSIIYTMGYDRFGPVKQNKAPPQKHDNQRQQKIAKIRSEVRQLTKRYKEANEAEREALAELRDDCKLKLKKLRQAENNRKQRKKRNQKRAEFIANPFKFTKKLLSDKASGQLVIPKDEIEKHIKKYTVTRGRPQSV